MSISFDVYVCMNVFFTGAWQALQAVRDENHHKELAMQENWQTQVHITLLQRFERLGLTLIIALITLIALITFLNY